MLVTRYLMAIQDVDPDGYSHVQNQTQASMIRNHINVNGSIFVTTGAVDDDQKVNLKHREKDFLDRKNREDISKFVVEMYNGRTDCRLLEDGAHWLGRGQQGLVWSAVMDCGGDKRDVTVKQVFKGDIGSAQWKGPAQWKDLYDAMVSNSTEDDVDKHFSIPIGHVHMSPNVTWHGVAFKNDIVSISNMAPGKKLISEFQNGLISQSDKRQQIVQHLVHMYRHLFDRGVLYCDMKTGMQHILHSTSTSETTLIDFDNIRIFDVKAKDYNHFVRAHTHQLLSLLAMICEGMITRKNADFKVDTSELCQKKPRRGISKEHESRLITALDQCQFRGSSNKIVAGFERVDGVMASYDVLMQWCGIR